MVEAAAERLKEVSGIAAGSTTEVTGNSAENVTDVAENSAGSTTYATENSAGNVTDVAENSAGSVTDATENSAGNVTDVAENFAESTTYAAENSAESTTYAAENSAGSVTAAAETSAGNAAETAAFDCAEGFGAVSVSAREFFLSDVVVTRIDGVRSRESKRDMNYFYCRPHHALIYKVSGEMTCWFGKREVSFSKNDIVYIPRGMTYRSKLRSDGRYIIIDFDTLLDYPADEIIVARFENHSNLYSLFSKCAEEWAFRDTAHTLSCKAYVYKILALMARQLDGSDKELRAKLAPAIEYMRLHINDQSLTTEKLAEAAGMSEPYFRSLFGQLYIVPPKRYIISVRIGQAKSMLEEGTSVARTAEAVGFTDTESFTKLFKREAGMSPRDWARRGPCRRNE